jgi:hypothetical protein
MKTLHAIKKNYIATCQKIGAVLSAPTKGQLQCALFLSGVVLLTAGLGADAVAQRAGGVLQYNNVRLTSATNGILLYLEGSFGALVMVASGIGAILSSAFGQYRAALGLMVVAVGSFILRSLMSTFFNDTGIQT